MNPVLKQVIEDRKKIGRQLELDLFPVRPKIKARIEAYKRQVYNVDSRRAIRNIMLVL
jgi:hypothetical protein